MRYSSLTQCGFSMASFLQVEGYRLEPCGIAVNSLVSVASWMCRGVLPLVLALRQRQNAKAGTTVVDVTVWSSHFHAQTLAFIEHSPLSFTASHVAIPSIQTLVSQIFRNHFFLKKQQPVWQTIKGARKLSQIHPNPLKLCQRQKIIQTAAIILPSPCWEMAHQVWIS